MARRRLAPVLLGVLLAGCGNGAPSGLPAQSGAMAGTTGPATATPPGSGSASGAPGAIIEGPGDLVLGDVAFGLDALGAHTSTLIESFEGTIGGSAATWTVTTTLDVGTDPGVRSMRVTITGSPPDDAAALQTALIDGAAYQIDADGCTATLADGGSASAFPEPGASLPGLVGASAAGSESINAVAVESYTFDGLALGIPDAAAASGRVSLAMSDQHVVRYTLVEKGGPDLLGEDWDGTFTTTYDVTTGDPPAIDLPADCPAGPIAFSVPNEATNLSVGPGQTSFSYPGTVANAVGVIRGGSVLAGWTAGEAVISGDEAHLAFTAAGMVIDAFIATSDDGTLVELFATRT